MQKKAGPIALRSDRLTVEIAPPGAVYRGARFDWTGFVTQVTLDGRHTFCRPESVVPGRGSGGIGLCNEFGIEEPVGFDRAEPGQCFPKLGVGLLRRPDGRPYDFFRPYEIEPFPISVEHDGRSARFLAEPLPCRGYAVRLRKSLSVEANRLRIGYELENLGQERVETTEYCHNFVAVDEHATGPDYELRFGYPVSLGNPQPVLVATDTAIRWRHGPDGEFYARWSGFPRAGGHRWELIHLPTGTGMAETDDFVPCRVALWGAAHVISPEVFIGISLAPGESMAWTREYEFFA